MFVATYIADEAFDVRCRVRLKKDQEALSFHPSSAEVCLFHLFPLLHNLHCNGNICRKPLFSISNYGIPVDFPQSKSGTLTSRLLKLCRCSDLKVRFLLP